MEMVSPRSCVRTRTPRCNNGSYGNFFPASRPRALPFGWKTRSCSRACSSSIATLTVAQRWFFFECHCEDPMSIGSTSRPQASELGIPKGSHRHCFSRNDLAPRVFCACTGCGHLQRRTTVPIRWVLAHVPSSSTRLGPKGPGEAKRVKRWSVRRAMN